MLDKGLAHMGVGYGKGETRAQDAAREAISSPLLETSIVGATGVLLNVTGDSELGLLEINEAAEIVQEAADPDANIIFGTVIDETLKDEIRITVIATGFEKERQRMGMGAQGVTSGATQTQREVIVENVEEKVAEQEVAASSQTQQEDRYNDDLEIPMFLRRGRR